MPSSPGSVGLARAHPLTKTQAYSIPPVVSLPSFHPEMPSSPGSVGLARAHPLTKPQAYSIPPVISLPSFVVVVVVVLTLTHGYNAVRGHRTGSIRSLGFC